MEARRLIFHIDVNSAFLSWESVYRLSLNPDAQDLRLIPSAVGGDVSSRHGIILAKSTPAKKSGVVTAETIASALRKCPELIIVPSRFDIYSSYSRQMLNLLSEYTPDIEKFSIDEAFLDMTETIHLFGRPSALPRGCSHENVAAPAARSAFCRKIHSRQDGTDWSSHHWRCRSL